MYIYIYRCMRNQNVKKKSLDTYILVVLEERN